MRYWRSKAARLICERTKLSDPIAAIVRHADSLLDRAEVSAPPVDVAMLASWQRVRGIDYIEMLEAGRLVPEGTGLRIQINSRHSKVKQRFTIGHEIGHTFFRSLSDASSTVDANTGLFDDHQEEEFLCDMAAANILLNRRWLDPMAATTCPGLKGLLMIAEKCGASIEATAVQLSRCESWDGTFVFWEPGFGSAERSMHLQYGLEGFAAPVAPKLRAKKVLSGGRGPFFPTGKSVDDESSIGKSRYASGIVTGIEEFELGARRVLAGHCESLFVPFHDETGSLRDRVVSFIRWLDDGGGHRAGQETPRLL